MLFIFQERKKFKVDSVYKCKVKQIHLFPTFIELEHGFAPSTSEMGIYNDCYLALNFTFPQYFDTDHSLEKERFNTTDFGYQQTLNRKRGSQLIFYDYSHLKANSCNMAYFEALQEELMEYVTAENIQSEFSQSLCTNTLVKDDDSVDRLTNQIEITDVAESLKKDCLLSLDIKNDLEKKLYHDSSGMLREELDEIYTDGFWKVDNNNHSQHSEMMNYLDMLNDEYMDNNSISLCPESLSNLEDNYQTTSNYADKLIDHDDDEYLALPNRQRLPDYNDDCDVDTENYLNDETDFIYSMKSKGSTKSTNPFLENFNGSFSDLEASMKNLVLNSNNPFLTGPLKDSNKSSGSTDYCTITSNNLNLPQWSSEDSTSGKLSNFEEEASTDFITTQEENINPHTAVSIQNMEHVPIYNNEMAQQIIPSPLIPGVLPNQSVYPQNWNSYYPPQPAIYDKMIPNYYPYCQYYANNVYATGYMAPSSSVEFLNPSTMARPMGPPPGFSANSNIYKVNIMQTTVSSNVVTNNHNQQDFYESYNKKLLQALQGMHNP